MFERFTDDAKAVVAAAFEEANSRASDQVGAEHLLLACCRIGTASEALNRGGLDHDALGEALQADEEASLREVGATPIELAPSDESTKRLAKNLPHDASFDAALRAAVDAAKERGDRRIEGFHIAAGALGMERGAVPRALRHAGLEGARLRAAL